jgi:hypothetical protein
VISFPPFAFEIPPWLPPDLALPAVVGGGCAVAVLVALVVIRAMRRRPVPFVPAPAEPEKAADPDFDPFVAGSASEKRNTRRRKGNPVKVLIRGPGIEEEHLVGCVFDRSSGGIALSVPVEFPNGTRLQVRSESGVDGLWVTLEVRSARRDHGEWQLGCRFVETPAWSTLLQFG